MVLYSLVPTCMLSLLLYHMWDIEVTRAGYWPSFSSCGYNNIAFLWTETESRSRNTPPPPLAQPSPPKKTRKQDQYNSYPDQTSSVSKILFLCKTASAWGKLFLCTIFKITNGKIVASCVLNSTRFVLSLLLIEQAM